MSFLALDFDGVVSNSARETFVTGLRSYLQLEPESRLADHPCNRNLHPERHDFDGDPLFAGLLDLIPLGNRAEDFGVAFVALDRQLTVSNQGAYNQLMAGIDREWLKRYHQVFYEQRAADRARDLEAWLSLSRPYSEMIDLLDRHRQTPMAIVTAKDARSVRLLLDRYGIGTVFADDQILDKDTGVSKTVHLRRIHTTHNLPLAEITFVDDKVNHLEAVAPLGVTCVLADWGFNSDREQQRARQLGFEVLSLDDAGRLFA